MSKLIIVFLLVSLCGCGGETIFHRKIPLVSLDDSLPITARDSTPCNPNANKRTKAVLRYIAALSENPNAKVISGQNCGHTSDIYDTNSLMSYNTLITELHKTTGKTIGIVGVDYGQTRIFTPKELSRANKVLIKHWNKGGLVAVNWSAVSPWRNDESDIKNNPGTWADLRTRFMSSSEIAEMDLNKLIDPKEPIHKVWRKKLDRIADALLELQRAGVVVLFKPLQEQNGFWFWWGPLTYEESPEPYIMLYRDMFNYFTYTKKLNNLLWLYAPNRNGEKLSRYHKGQMWVYPGDDYIDIITPTIYNNSGKVYDYKEFLATGKPLGMGEMGPDHADNHGNFDNRIYARSLTEHYTAMAFWISWHDWENGDGTNTYMSIRKNKYAQDLLTNPKVLNCKDLKWRRYLTQ